jgi:RNA polymerase sigma-70 factor (ECF subfamily)
VTDRPVIPSEPTNSTSSSLLVRLKAQDNAAWERLVDLYSPLVYRWCRRAGLQADDAADVGQEVFRKVFQKIAGFRHDRAGDTFRGWLRTITRNTLLDRAAAMRPGWTGVGVAQAHDLLLDLPAPGPGGAGEPDEAAETGLLYRRAVELIRSEFTEKTWRAFWRVTVDGQRPVDAAQDLGLTVNAIYLARSHVLRRLREEFDGLVEF